MDFFPVPSLLSIDAVNLPPLSHQQLIDAVCLPSDPSTPDPSPEADADQPSRRFSDQPPISSPLHQIHGKDCGAYTMAFSEYYAMKKMDLLKSDFDIEAFRQRVACLLYQYGPMNQHDSCQIVILRGSGRELLACCTTMAQ